MACRDHGWPRSRPVARSAHSAASGDVPASTSKKSAQRAPAVAAAEAVGAERRHAAGHEARDRFGQRPSRSRVAATTGPRSAGEARA